MRYKLLGRSGLRVSEMCLGTMTFGDRWSDWGMATDRSTCRAIWDAFTAAGGNFIDTANGYNHGDSERVVGELIASDRDRWVVATKYAMSLRPDDPNAGGNHRKNLVHSLEASLRRLRTDFVDLFWLHVWDATTPLDEVMRALDDVVRAGKTRYIGISDTPAWVVARANTYAQLRGSEPFVGLQLQYNLLERAADRELLPMARALDLGVVAWSPLAMGLLTGKYTGAGQPPDAPGPRGRLDLPAMASQGRLNARSLALAGEVARLSREIGWSPTAVALRWLLHRGTIPILGVRSVAQLQDNLGSLGRELPPEVVGRLDELTRPELGFPHDFIASVRPVVLGQAADQLDIHRATA